MNCNVLVSWPKPKFSLLSHGKFCQDLEIAVRIFYHLYSFPAIQWCPMFVGQVASK